MQEIKYDEKISEVFQLLQKGAFATTKSEDKINTMTISWGHIGFAWNKPVFTVMVRKSRMTYANLESSNEFTISVPTSDQKKALAFCGSKSGRDVDKLKECNFNTMPSKNISTPILNIKGIHFECKVICKTEMNPSSTDKSIIDTSYAQGDYHTLYFGEVLGSYII